MKLWAAVASELTSLVDIACEYVEYQEKPGLKVGTIEAVHQRLNNLEQMILGQGLLLRPLIDATRNQVPPGTTDIPLFSEQLEAIQASYHATAPKTPRNPAIIPDSSPRASNTAADLPPQAVLHDLVEVYFEHYHPWIPILHQTVFRKKFLQYPQQQPEIKVILQAITSTCLRFEGTSTLSYEDKEKWCLRCKNAVIIHALENISLESLQALIIVTFGMIGSGKSSSTWSLVGLMARTVEHLQLNIEEGEHNVQKSLFHGRRITFLKPSRTWLQSEDRRRLFWTVFQMDRFCSIATGWNNSLTEADVNRRLPAEGTFWLIGQAVKAPWFNTATRLLSPQETLTSEDRHVKEKEEIESIGGFAYSIDATENLNLVTQFFLKRIVNFEDKLHLQSWLIKFKELDNRLFQ